MRLGIATACDQNAIAGRAYRGKYASHYKHSEAFSLQIATEDQEETDRYWNAIVGNGGQESQVRLV